MPPELDEPREVPTPDMTTVADVSSALGVPSGALLKAVPVIAEERGMVMVLVRGDHRLNEIKLANALGEGFRQATRRGDRRADRPRGLHRAGRRRGARGQGRRDPAAGGYVCGANSPDAHLIGVEPGRDFAVRGDGRALGRGRRHAPRAAPRSRSSPRSRSGTSSSSARATPRRSARPTSTSPARSTRS